jgi:hypothetical protein
MKWSLNFITVKTNENFKLISKPSEYRLYDKCYDTFRSVENNYSLVIPLYYQTMSEINDRDFIKFIFIDKDCYNGECFMKNEYESDLGMKNIEYEITP